MNMMANLATDDSIENETDTVGGGGPLESGLYNCTIDVAYIGKSAGGAANVTLHLKTEDGRQIRQTVYVTSGDAKGNKNFYTNAAGEKKYLPGFNVINSLCLLTVGKEVAELDTEEKVVNVYSFDAGKEVPTKVPMLTELLDQPITVGLQKLIEDKNAKGDDGKYHPTGETRETNEIDKVFRAKDGMTTAEIRANAEEPAFRTTWEEKWTGVTRDKSTKGVTSGNTGQVGAPGAAAANTTAKPKQSLFGS